MVRIQEILDELTKQDIYHQPVDVGHTELTKQVIDYFENYITENKGVLDIGANGNSFLFFQKLGLGWVGVNLGEDYKLCQSLGYPMMESDMTYLDLPSNSVDLIFSRHVLEHSAMPLVTLINWNIIAKKHLLLVVPNPKHYTVFGQNHYSVLYQNQWLWLLARAGWRTLKEKVSDTEFWFYCQKDKPRKHAPYELTEYDEQENQLT